MQLYDTIQHAPPEFPASPAITPELQDLLIRLLQKDPHTRITMPEIFRHAWVTMDDNLPLQSLQVCPCSLHGQKHACTAAFVILLI